MGSFLQGYGPLVQKSRNRFLHIKLAGIYLGSSFQPIVIVGVGPYTRIEFSENNNDTSCSFCGN